MGLCSHPIPAYICMYVCLCLSLCLCLCLRARLCLPVCVCNFQVTWVEREATQKTNGEGALLCHSQNVLIYILEAPPETDKSEMIALGAFRRFDASRIPPVFKLASTFACQAVIWGRSVIVIRQLPLCRNVFARCWRRFCMLPESLRRDQERNK